MKCNSVRHYSAILCVFLSIRAITQTVSKVTGGNRDVQGNIETHKIKVVDDKLKAAGEMMRAQPPNYDQAIAILTEATQMAPDQDVVWYRLGVAYLGAANTQGDAAESMKRATEAYNDLERAIDLFKHRKDQELQEDISKPACNIQGVCTHVEPAKTGATSDDYKLAVYHSNLGDAAAKLGKNDEALKDFEKAAQLDPADAATYYFDEGVILRNTAKTVDGRRAALNAFNKTIAADPNKAAAYYLKGEVLFGFATTDREGKIIPPPGTVEALQKYLKLQPNGPYSPQAKDFLVVLNCNVESSCGTDKSTSKKH